MARKMLTMTHDINEKFFDGKMEVKCFTCHKGASHPVSDPPGYELEAFRAVADCQRAVH